MANGTTLGTAYVQIVPSAQGIKGSITTALGGEPDSAGKSAGQKIASGIKWAVIGAGIGTAIAKSITAGGELQQSIGGIETMFKSSADKVIANADKAFATAGLSANDYMQQVTSFSATLLQGLQGDTAKAVDYADMAIVDMSDNANKFGTDVKSIQNAYQGFAKQNYTMLDNLKLGYGGTASEMARLINDSNVLGDSVEVTAQTVKNVPFDQVIEAIHTIQGRLGVTGTTSKEAAETFSGSMASMKAAAENVMANLALGRDIKPSLEALAQSVSTFLTDNLFPMIKNIISALPEAINILSTAIKPMLPDILQGITDIIKAVIELIIEAMPMIVDAVFDIVIAVADALAKVDWGAMLSSVFSKIVQAFEKNPFAMTLTLGLVAVKLSGGLDGLIQKLSTALGGSGGAFSATMKIGIGLMLAYAGIQGSFDAFKTETFLDDLVSVLETAGGGAMIGWAVGGPAGAAIGALIGLEVSMQITQINMLMDPVNRVFDASVEYYKNKVEELSEAGVITAAKAASLRDQLTSGNTEAFNRAAEFLDVYVDQAEKAAYITEQATGSMASSFADGINSAGDAVFSGGGRIEESVEETTVAVTSAMEGMGASIEANVQSMVTETVLSFDTLTEKEQGVVETIGVMITSMQGALQSYTGEAKNMFAEVDRSSWISSKQLLINLTDQVTMLKEWETNLATLAQRGIDENLLQRLVNMGPSGAEYVAAFANMTDDEFAAATAQWSESLNIEEFANTEFTNFTNTAATAIAGGTEELKGLMTGMGTDSLQGLVDGWQEASERAAEAVKDTAKDMQTAYKGEMQQSSPSRRMQTFGKDTVQGLVNGIKNSKGSAKSAMSDVARVMTTSMNSVTTNVQAAMNRMYSVIAGTLASIRMAFASTHLRLNTYIPLPHFWMSGAFNAKSGQVPYVGVQWYKNAAEYGAIFDHPQIIGVGDAAQPEILLGTDKLRELFEDMPNKSTTINVYGAPGQDVRELANIIEQKISRNVNRRAAAW